MWNILRNYAHPNTIAFWSLLLGFAVVDAVLLPLSGMTVAAAPMFFGMIPLGIMLGVSAFYTCVRKDARIAAMTQISAGFLMTIAILAILSYMSVSWRMPLVDHVMAAADRALGLDWRAAYDFTMRHAVLHSALLASYASIKVQMIALILTLTFSGRIRRAWEALWMFLVSCIGCIAVSSIWPAMGAFGYYHIEENRAYVRIFKSLYDGTLTIIGKDAIDGVVQFPSLHAAIAILFTYAVRGVPVLFPVLLVLNTAMFLATPTIGGHYFADVWGGVALALASIYAVKKITESGLLPEDVAVPHQVRTLPVSMCTKSLEG